MSLIIIIFLAVIQGLTEFLPVSSSGHLVLTQNFFGFGESALFLDVVLHAATLGAVLWVYKKDLLWIFQDCLRALKSSEKKNALKEAQGVRVLLFLILATIPTGMIGLFFRDFLAGFFAKPQFVGVFLVVTGVLLWCTGLGGHRDKGRFSAQETPYWMILILGFVQGLAILPGISRSGITISVALFLGLKREWAARFSFLMSIPAILGATLLEALKVDPGHWNFFHLGIGFGVALLVGVLSLKLTIHFVETGRFRHFAYYVVPLGVLAFCYFQFYS